MKLKNVLKSSLPLWNRTTVKPVDKYNCRRTYVSSLRTPLATAINAKPSIKAFNLRRNETGLFGMSELKEPTGLFLLKGEAMQAADRLVAEACSSNRRRKMVVIFDELSDELCRVADMAEFIRVAHPDPKFQSAAEDASISINAVVERLNTNQDLYNAIMKVVTLGDVVPTDDVDRHVAKLFLFDFEQSGIHLDETKRKRVVALNDALLQSGALFMRGSSSARLLPRDSLPPSISSLFPSHDKNLVFTNLYSDSSLELVRQTAYKVYMYPDENQESRLKNLLLSREELAHLCNFPTFAHRVLRGSLAENPETVQNFLDNLSQSLKPLAQLEFNAMQALKSRQNPGSDELQMWDVPYYSSVLKKELISLDVSDCVRYFSLGVCLDGLSLLLHSLYRVTLQLEDLVSGEAWSDDIYKLAVVHDDEGLLGYVYLDLFERPGKPNQDCHFTIRGGRELPNKTYQLPVVVLMFSFPSHSRNTPCLLSPGMVENLFHEMGHAMHSMLARTKYQHVTGTRCCTDFAEVPSILMEYFAADPRILSTFARDYSNGEAIPKELLHKLCKSRNSLSASELQLQVFYAALDQRYHGNLQEVGLTDDGEFSTTDVLAKVQESYYNIPHVPLTAWQLRFNHLIGYGAKYYSYLLSKSVASWIWQEHFERNPLSREAGERYRKQVLAHGGGRPPKLILKEFLGKEMTSKKLTQVMTSEIKQKSEFALM